MEHTLLRKTLALPIFSSDALSSVAYATEQILLVLAVLSTGRANYAPKTSSGEPWRLLTAMFVVFAILVHAPLILIDPHTHMHWAENAVNIALIGSAWVIAASINAGGKGSSTHSGLGIG
jgi:hypothetical protein